MSDEKLKFSWRGLGAANENANNLSLHRLWCSLGAAWQSKGSVVLRKWMNPRWWSRWKVPVEWRYSIVLVLMRFLGLLSPQACSGSLKTACFNVANKLWHGALRFYRQCIFKSDQRACVSIQIVPSNMDACGRACESRSRSWWCHSGNPMLHRSVDYLPKACLASCLRPSRADLLPPLKIPLLVISDFHSIRIVSRTVGWPHKLPKQLELSA